MKTKTLKEGEIPPLAWMVLVIIGNLCLYYYCGTVAASMDRDRNGNEKRSLHTPRLAVIFGSVRKLALHWETGFTYYRSAQGRGNQTIGKHLYSAKSILFLTHNLFVLCDSLLKCSSCRLKFHQRCHLRTKCH